jgi:C4-dicarboxylate transporter DctQ subunit
MLYRVCKAIDRNLERWLVIGSYMYLVLIILVEVIRRHMFGASSEWGEMTARYAFVFLVYVATAHVAINRDHIRIDVVPKALSDRGRFFLYVYFDLLHLVLVSLTVFFSIRVMHLQVENGVLMSGLDMNMAFAQVALPIGFTLLGYRVICRMLKMIREYRATGVVALGGEAQSV